MSRYEKRYSNKGAETELYPCSAPGSHNIEDSQHDLFSVAPCVSEQQQHQVAKNSVDSTKPKAGVRCQSSKEEKRLKSSFIMVRGREWTRRRRREQSTRMSGSIGHRRQRSERTTAAAAAAAAAVVIFPFAIFLTFHSAACFTWSSSTLVKFSPTRSATRSFRPVFHASKNGETAVSGGQEEQPFITNQPPVGGRTWVQRRAPIHNNIRREPPLVNTDARPRILKPSSHVVDQPCPLADCHSGSHAVQ